MPVMRLSPKLLPSRQSHTLCDAAPTSQESRDGTLAGPERVRERFPGLKRSVRPFPPLLGGASAFSRRQQTHTLSSFGSCCVGSHRPTQLCSDLRIGQGYTTSQQHAHGWYTRLRRQVHILTTHSIKTMSSHSDTTFA